MTFDEAVDKILFDSFEDVHDDDVIYTEDVISLIKILKEEYAPDIEMTKEQYELANELLREFFKREDLPFKIHEEAMNAWLHPETIKVVDE